MITTSVSRKTKAFFESHPLYAVGRALDDWVNKQEGKEVDEQAERLAEVLKGLDVGACGCGRITWKRRGPEECVACQGPPKDCKCQPTNEKRRKDLLEWQLARSRAGLTTTSEDIEAKKAELGLSWDHSMVVTPAEVPDVVEIP